MRRLLTLLGLLLLRGQRREQRRERAVGGGGGRGGLAHGLAPPVDGLGLRGGVAPPAAGVVGAGVAPSRLRGDSVARTRSADDDDARMLEVPESAMRDGRGLGADRTAPRRQTGLRLDPLAGTQRRFEQPMQDGAGGPRIRS